MSADVVLLVEDQADTREVIRIVLEDLIAVQAVLAHDGKEALALLAKEAPRLVLLDLVLPDMRGIEIVRLLKNDPNKRKVPVIAVTALGKGCEEARRAGCDDCIEKPFEICNLIAKVESYLLRRAAANG
jgi:CheY-like chemotaxis protein